MITFPNAKINLGLNIVEKRPDGYHNLETIFYPINLQDALEVTRRENNDKEYTLHISGSPLEGEPEDNLVVKAYKLLKKDYPGLLPVDIHMYKHIPAGAGLGGGSSDAACMIKLLNDKFSLGLSTERMEEYAVKLGADCAFFIRNKPVFATGIGNLFEPVELSLKGYHIILIKPDIFVSTRDAFAEIKPVRPAVSLKEIVKQPMEAWKNSMKNDFEDSVFKKFPEIAAIKDELYDLGAVYAAMSGSGSSVYGIFKAPIENVEDKFCGCFCRQRALE
ncbi:4-(cytidine 5'-diphospho)-2-C-methyl-D-erythritol kinase [Phocaeicola vulgatus]|uniref:4-(cytidine 5'-diphospho)-2-C-methyl-D-erythritol kinase n=1 Tax=Phocaeicola vulgatus TaxID=821 RepID=UPI000E4ABB92|nr:4-(cytidine 5'-diphospho)-2-C-methyl-D-erythritol kinase [Phocaeicola vulgatus]RGQ19693.1 4-(cytidine 5'-diphospho)-2-C-methyl-D-erythritol kinase [Phocaeicola vulgatus]